MKRIINMLLSMIYPALICLFIFCFASAFIEASAVYTSYKEPMQTISAILAFIFGALFVAGFIWNIIYSIKNKDEK